MVRTRIWRDPGLRLTRLRVTGPNEESHRPGVEPIRIAEPRQLTPGDHQRLLHGVLGSVDIAEDPSGDRVQPVASRAGKDREGVSIASLCLLHEIAIHPSDPSDGAQWGAFHQY